MSLVDMLLEQGGAQAKLAALESMTAMPGANQGSYNGSVRPSGGSSNWENVAKRIATNQYGYSPQDFNALDYIIDEAPDAESHWDPNAQNPTSPAAGIAQRISGYGKGYEQDRPKQQIRWLLNYIADRYGTPQEAMDFKQREGWY